MRIGSTAERTVLYHKKNLKPDEVSNSVINYIVISKDDFEGYDYYGEEDENGYTTIYKNYEYQYGLDIEVDAIQAHHAKEAIEAEWMIEADVNDNETEILELL